MGTLSSSYLQVLDARKRGKKLNGIIIPGKCTNEIGLVSQDENKDGLYDVKIYIDAEMPNWSEDENIWAPSLLRQTGMALLIANECETLEIEEYDTSDPDLSSLPSDSHKYKAFELFSHIATQYCGTKLKPESFDRLAPIKFGMMIDPERDTKMFRRYTKIFQPFTLIQKIVSGSVINVFLSQPMTGKSTDEILTVKEDSIKRLIDLMDENLQMICNPEVFDLDKIRATMNSRIHVYSNYDSINHNIRTITEEPLKYFGQAVYSMTDKDVILFAPGWEKSSGCRMEHYITYYASKYLKRIYFN